MNRKPKLQIVHPNVIGTGTAVTLELIPATGTAEGAMLLTAARQKTIGKVLPVTELFDWENAVKAALTISDMAKLLEVFRGYCESVADGKGIFHVTERQAVVVRLSHIMEPMVCYRLSVSRKLANESMEPSVDIMLTMPEATVLSSVIDHALFYMALGVPESQN